MPSALNLVYIDALLLAYRLGRIRHEEEKVAMIAAARTGGDSIGYMTALENFGVARRSRLYRFVGEIVASPAHYRSTYPNVCGLREEGRMPETFLGNLRVMYLVEPVLTAKQQKLFSDAYWWFVNNHQEAYHDVKKGRCLGVFANEPKDNASTLTRFGDYLGRLINHRNQSVRKLYEGFPADFVQAILERAFL